MPPVSFTYYTASRMPSATSFPTSDVGPVRSLSDPSLISCGQAAGSVSAKPSARIHSSSDLMVPSLSSISERPKVEVVLELLPAVGEPLGLVEQEQHDGEPEGRFLHVEEALGEGRIELCERDHGELQQLQDHGDEDGAEGDAVQAPDSADEDDADNPQAPRELKVLGAHEKERRDPHRSRHARQHASGEKCKQLVGHDVHSHRL